MDGTSAFHYRHDACSPSLTMKLLAAVGGAAAALVVSAALVLGAYLVELDGGGRMSVDSYWTDGDRVHLLEDGRDLSVPRAHIRSIGEVPGREPSGSREARARRESIDASDAASRPDPTR